MKVLFNHKMSLCRRCQPHLHLFPITLHAQGHRVTLFTAKFVAKTRDILYGLTFYRNNHIAALESIRTLRCPNVRY